MLSSVILSASQHPDYIQLHAVDSLASRWPKLLENTLTAIFLDFRYTVFLPVGCTL